MSDLSNRLDVNADAIEVASVQEVTWSDGSLGCPQPGMVYTQALVEGSRVVLEHEDRFYDYHAGADDMPFLCESDAKDGGHDSSRPWRVRPETRRRPGMTPGRRSGVEGPPRAWPPDRS